MWKNKLSDTVSDMTSKSLVYLMRTNIMNSQKKQTFEAENKQGSDGVGALRNAPLQTALTVCLGIFILTVLGGYFQADK